jgi:hypothetical protein
MTKRGLPERVVATLTAGISPEAIMARMRSGETRNSRASSLGV